MTDSWYESASSLVAIKQENVGNEDDAFSRPSPRANMATTPETGDTDHAINATLRGTSVLRKLRDKALEAKLSALKEMEVHPLIR